MLVEKFCKLQGIESTIFLSGTFLKLKTLVPLIKKGMKILPIYRKLSSPGTSAIKTGYSKKVITEILSVHGQDLILREDSLLSLRLSISMLLV